MYRTIFSYLWLLCFVVSADNSIMTAKNEKEIKSPTKKKLKSVENNSIAFFDKSNQLNTETSDGFDKQGGIFAVL